MLILFLQGINLKFEILVEAIFSGIQRIYDHDNNTLAVQRLKGSIC